MRISISSYPQHFLSEEVITNGPDNLDDSKAKFIKKVGLNSEYGKVFLETVIQ